MDYPPKVILARNPREAIEYCKAEGIDADKVVVVRGFRSLEGLRFYPDDVIRVEGWQDNPDLEIIEEIIRRTGTLMGRRNGTNS